MIFIPSKPKIIKKGNNKAIFEIDALYPGYGCTIGNSLRRVLLSSLEGAAVTKFKIEGVHHEFFTIKGVIEDIITISLNLKKLRFKMHNKEPQKITLKIKGEREVRSSDLEIPTQLELINKDIHIASLTDKKAELNMEIQVEKGMGYVITEQEKREKLEVGEIAIDSIFTPIIDVNFRVENMRVGERTDFDKLFLEVETDGTISPEEAFDASLKLLSDHFSSLIIDEEGKGEEKKMEKEEIKEEIKEDIRKIKVEDMNLGVRTANILIKDGIKTLGGILKKDEEKLMGIEGMGEKGIKEIKKALKKFDLKLQS